MRINNNIAAFNAYRNLSQTQNGLSSSLEKLSSGFRINRAADDASGLVNSENLRSQIGGLKVATRNAQDAISLVQTAEGAQTEVHSILQRMRDLVVQSGNLGTNDESALQANQSEINELAAELNRISDQTQFGTRQILNGDFQTQGGPSVAVALGAQTQTPGDGTNTSSVAFDVANLVRPSSGEFTLTVGGQTTAAIAHDADAAAITSALSALTGFTAANASGTITVTSDANSADPLTVTGATVASEVTGGALFQVGANAEQQVRVGIAGVSAAALGVDQLDVTSEDIADIDAALRSIDTAISTVSENRATLGAFQNRMESTIRNVSVAVENLSAAESRIRDTDMADEMVNFTRNQILQQAGTAMLAQANQVPQSVLSLLR